MPRAQCLRVSKEIAINGIKVVYGNAVAAGVGCRVDAARECLEPAR